jgi:hypothetical protein
MSDQLFSLLSIRTHTSSECCQYRSDRFVLSDRRWYRQFWEPHPTYGAKLGFRIPRKISLLATLLFIVVLLDAETVKTPDMKTVAAAGHVKGTEYANSYFGVSVRLPQPNEHLILNGLVAENRAILLEAVNGKGESQKRRKFVIVAYSSDIPGLTSTTQFVRSVRHQLEREGFQTTRAEVRVVMEGHEFIRSDLKMKSENYWKAIILTQIKGYMFGFWMEAATEEELAKATKLDGRIFFR